MKSARRRLAWAFLLMSSCLPPSLAFAQSTEVGVTGMAQLSIQPTDDFYVGSPYLSQALGGVGPGFGAALSLVTTEGVVVLAEFTTATLEVEQEGRLVGGSGPRTGQLRDSIVAGLVGQAWSSDRRRIQVVVGLGRLLGSPSLDGVPIDASRGGSVDPAAQEGSGRVVITGGTDFSQRVSPRVAFVVGMRYSRLSRSRRAREIGVGPNVLRAGIGLRVRITD